MMATWIELLNRRPPLRHLSHHHLYPIGVDGYPVREVDLLPDWGKAVATVGAVPLLLYYCTRAFPRRETQR